MFSYIYYHWTPVVVKVKIFTLIYDDLKTTTFVGNNDQRE